MEINIAEDKLSPGDFRCEAFGNDGECYTAIFVGPDAENRAREYAIFITSQGGE